MNKETGRRYDTKKAADREAMEADAADLTKRGKDPKKVIVPVYEYPKPVAYAPCNKAKRARKAAGVHGHKASKRYYRDHRSEYATHG